MQRIIETLILTNVGNIDRRFVGRLCNFFVEYIFNPLVVVRKGSDYILDRTGMFFQVNRKFFTSVESGILYRGVSLFVFTI